MLAVGIENIAGQHSVKTKWGKLDTNCGEHVHFKLGVLSYFANGRVFQKGLELAYYVVGIKLGGPSVTHRYVECLKRAA